MGFLSYNLMEVGIIGAGLIGSALYKKLQSIGWNVRFILRKSGLYETIEKKLEGNYLDYAQELDAAFLAIPTADDGLIAAGYIKSFVDRGIPVITCEKGALSNHFASLESCLERIGFSACVGGGTRLLSCLKERSSMQIQETHAVVNGTLNYIFDEVSHGRNMPDAVKRAQELGYAEPGAEEPLDVINQEASGDIPMKTAILFNVGGFGGSHIHSAALLAGKLDDAAMKELLKNVSDRRYIVSFTREDKKEDVIGGFKHYAGDWVISAGFKNINDNPLYRLMLPSGVNNSLLINEGKNETYVLSGPGAGAGPTTSSMLIDAFRLVQKK